MIGFSWEVALVTWVGYGFWLLARAWYGRTPVAGLLLGYYLNLNTAHSAAELMSLVSRGASNVRTESALGFEQCGWAVVGLMIGELLMSAVYRPRPVRIEAARPTQELGLWSNAAVLAAVVGMSLYLFSRLFDLASIPALGTILNAGNMLVAAGFAWLWWVEWSAGRTGRGLLMLAVSAAVPFLTIVFSGFIGFGIQIISMIFAVVLTSVRRKWWLLLAGLPVGYLTLSVFVTYMAGRSVMRESIWHQVDDLSDRSRLVSGHFLDRFELFDPDNTFHFAVVDTRLNQNYFLGLTVQRIELGLIEHEYGDTYANGFWALVPRALWADKPRISGGNELVSRWTGLSFAEGTSVGEGHILDLYANFGSAGVVIGMAVLAGLLRALDVRAGREMRRYSFENFCPWFMAGGIMCIGSFGRITELPPAILAAFLLGQGFRLVARSVVAPSSPDGK